MNWGITVSMRDQTFKLTLKEYLEHYEAEVPDCPSTLWEVGYIWNYWNRIRARTPSGDGVSPVTFEGIDAFIRLTGEIVTQDDIVMLEALDNAFMSQVSIERAEQAERQRQEAEAKRK